jgi:hypothetical protein
MSYLASLYEEVETIGVQLYEMGVPREKALDRDEWEAVPDYPHIPHGMASLGDNFVDAAVLAGWDWAAGTKPLRGATE